jgi:hypothetical protein
MAGKRKKHHRQETCAQIIKRNITGNKHVLIS